MAQSDGSIKIEISLQKERLNQGLNELSRNFEKGTKGLIKYERALNQIAGYETKLERLSQKMKDMEMGKIAPRDLGELEKQLKAVENKIGRDIYDEYKKLKSELEKALKVPLEKEDIEAAKKALAEFKTENQETVNDFEKLNAQVTELKNNISAITQVPTISTHYKELAEDVALLENKTLIAKHAANELYQDLIKVSTIDVKSTAQSMYELGNGIQNSVLSSTRLGSTFKSLARFILRAAKNVYDLVSGFKLFNRQAKNTTNHIGNIQVRMRSILWTVGFFAVIRRSLTRLRQEMGLLIRSNAEFAASWNAIKVNMATAFAPIWEAIIPALNRLVEALARATAYLARFISLLFGQSVAASRATANALRDQKNALDAVGGSAKDARKELFDFDTIQKMTAQDAGGAAGAIEGLDFSAVEIDEKVPAWMQLITDELEFWRREAQPTIEAMKRLWDAMEPFRRFVVQGLIDFYNLFLKPVGVWLLGTGLPALFDILSKMFQNINWEYLNEMLAALWKVLAPFAIKIGEGLLWFFDNVLRPLAEFTMNEIVPRVLRMIAAVVTILDAVLEAFKPIWLWFWDNFFLPIAKWTGGLIVVILEGITRALEGIGNWMKNNEPVVTAITIAVGAFFAAWKITQLFAFIQMSGGLVGALGNIRKAIWGATYAKLANKYETVALTAMYAKDFVVGIGKSTKALATQTIAWGKLTFAMVAAKTKLVLVTIKTWLFNAALWANPITWLVAAIVALIAIIVLLIRHWDKVIKAITKVWNKIVEIFGPMVEWFMDTFINPLVERFTKMWDILTAGFRVLVAVIKAVWSVVANWFNDRVIKPLVKFFTGLWDNVTKFATNSWESIKNVWNIVATWFNDTIIKPLTDFFSKFWTAMTTGFTNLRDGIKNIWRAVANWFNDTVVKPIADFFGRMWDGIRAGGGTLADWMRDKVITPIVNLFRTMHDTVVGILRGVINAFIGIINGFIRGLNLMISAINMIPGVNLSRIREIPQLAQGGIVSSPGLFMAGEAGAEVIPIQNNMGWADNVAARMIENFSINPMIMSAIAESGRAQGGNRGASNDQTASNYYIAEKLDELIELISNTATEIPLNVDGKELARIGVPLWNQEESRMGMRISNRRVSA